MKAKIKVSPVDRLFYWLSNTVLFLLALIIIIPLLNVVAQSLSSPMMVLSGRVTIFPLEFTLETYRLVLMSKSILTGFLNTLFYAVVGTVVNLVVTVLCAYPLARRELWGRNALMFVFTFTMMFGGGMIPTYLVIKKLGLLDTRAVMILPGAMAVWNMVMARTFFMNTIPQELYESAGMDGAGDGRILLSIVLPLSTPILAVLALFYAVGHWNSYFNAMMYLSTPSLYNIQLVLRNAIANLSSIMDNGAGDMANLTKNMASQEAAKYTIIVIAMLPVLMIYPFVQRFFIKGVMIGSIKG